MSLTATNYVNLINQGFPVRGQDNDSQGFRDNFTYIAQAITAVNNQTDFLNIYTIKTNSTASFYGNIVDSANFRNCSEELWDNGTQSGNITIDYSLGSYQTLSVESGINNITIINWPGEGTAALLTLSITSPVNVSTVVNFVGTNVQSLGPSENPYQLLYANNVFEIRSEYPQGLANNTLLIRLLNELIANSTSTLAQAADQFILHNPDRNLSHDEVLYINSGTGSINAITVSSNVSGNAVASNLGLVPNIIVSNITNSVPTVNPSPGYGSAFTVDSTVGIVNGATFNLITTSTILVVSSALNGVVYCDTTPFPVGGGIGLGKVYFRNPTFSDHGTPTAFPTLVTIVDQPANTSTGIIGNFKGAIYAEKNYLEVTYQDYGNNNTNTFVVKTLAETTVTDNSSALANTEFVHLILPYGSIIMWYGHTTNIPFGWVLCDGNNGTPDLRNKFIVGADSEQILAPGQTVPTAVSTIAGVSTFTGGQASLQLPQHTHDILGLQNLNIADHFHTITDPGHIHTNAAAFFIGGQASVGSDDLSLVGAPSNNIQGYPINNLVLVAKTGITQTNPQSLVIQGTATIVLTSSTTVDSIATGAEWSADVRYANIPPFYALCYIMKVTGK